MKVLILYGSEHGCGLDVARIIYRRAKTRKIACSAMSISDYDWSQLENEKLVLFIVSTVGQGSEPTPMKKFWSFIMKKSHPSDMFAHLQAAVIGLGDSSYMKFNVVGKKLFRRLISLGAKMIVDMATGDDSHDLGLWAGIDEWLPRFWDKIEQLVRPEKSFEIDDHDNHVPEATFSVHNSEDNQIKNISLNNTSEFSEIKPYYAIVTKNTRVTPDNHFQDVRLIDLQIEADSNSKLHYDPGDTAMIIPKNFAEEVDEFLALVHLDPEQEVSLVREQSDFNDINIYDSLSKPTSIRRIVAEYMDIHAVPRRSFFDLLWRFSKDETEREKLQEFASLKGQYDLYNYCHQPKRTILEVLKDFYLTIENVPLNYLFDLIPAIRSRAFSIASSLQMHPNSLQLLVAVVNYQTRLRKPRLGLCSNYIKDLAVNDTIRIWFQKGEFIIPKDKPLIMIGPGTGVAPFRAIIEDRIGRDISDNVLFFGCRNKSADYYFRDEWKLYQSLNMLKFFAAFSRDNPEQKVYVQHKMLENQELIYNLLVNEGAVVLIAGSSNKMPDDVRDCIKQILSKKAEKSSDEEIDQIVNKMEAIKRIQYECWN